MSTSPISPKLISIISYLLMPGWFFALILNNSNRTNLGTFHVRQSFGLMCLGTIVSIIVGLLKIKLLTYIALTPIIILWWIAFISAIQGKMRPIPFVGSSFQKWFGGI